MQKEEAQSRSSQGNAMQKYYLSASGLCLFQAPIAGQKCKMLVSANDMPLGDL